MYPNLKKENWKMSTYNQLDLGMQTAGGHLAIS